MLNNEMEQKIVVQEKLITKLRKEIDQLTTDRNHVAYERDLLLDKVNRLEGKNEA